MKKFYLLFLATLLVACTSCSTYYTRSISSVNSSYDTYRRERKHLDHTVLVAMLSYSSARVNSTPMHSDSDFKGALFAYIDAVEKYGVVSSSYPVKPTKEEIKYIRNFMRSFYSHAQRSRLSVKRMRQDYRLLVGSLISRLQELEYSGPR